MTLRDSTLVATLAAGGLVLVSVVARIFMNRHVQAPWIMPDELEYSELAKSFARSGHYLFRDQTRDLPTIYPAIISPAWFAGSMQTTYALTKAFNVVLMTLGAIPLWFWARRLVSPPYAVIAVVLFLAIPSFVYTGEIVTENAYLPAVMFALFALSLALERPTVVRQLVALALAGVVMAVRVQGVVFGLIIPTAILLKVVFDLRAAEGQTRRGVLRDAGRRWSLSLGIMAAFAVAYVADKASQGRSLSSGLGVYSQLGQTHYSVRVASRWVVYHFAELALSVGVVPFSALVVLIGISLRRRGPASPAERAFVAAATAAILWTTVEAGVFASHLAFRVEERYMFNVAPVLLLALAVWLGRGLPRPPALTTAAALLPAALVLALPYSAFFNISLYNDTFGLIVFSSLTTHLAAGLADLEVLIGLGMFCAGLLFASVPRRVALYAVPGAVLAFFIVSTISVFHEVEIQSAGTRHAGGSTGDPSWVDDAIGKSRRAVFLYTTDINADPHMLWQTEFWNRSVHRAFGINANDPSIPDVTAVLNPTTGRITPALSPGSPDLKPRFVVAASNVDVAGTRIARNGFLSLYRVSPPLRLRHG